MLSECQHGVKCYTQVCWVGVDWDGGVVECDVRLGGHTQMPDVVGVTVNLPSFINAKKSVLPNLYF